MTTIAHQAVTTSDAPAPVGPYNQAVQAGGWLYCSGQIPLDPASGEMVGNGDVEAETRQVLRNLQAVLSAAGTDASKVVRTTVYLVDLADFQAVNAIYAEMFGEGLSPARARWPPCRRDPRLRSTASPGWAEGIDAPGWICNPPEHPRPDGCIG